MRSDACVFFMDCESGSGASLDAQGVSEGLGCAVSCRGRVAWIVAGGPWAVGMGCLTWVFGYGVSGVWASSAK
jgi:hypothetical protein